MSFLHKCVYYQHTTTAFKKRDSVRKHFPDLSGVLPDGPECAKGDAVGQHGQQVDPEEQHVQHIAHLQPLLCDVSTCLSLL